MIPASELRLVASYRSRTETDHLRKKGDTHTLCCTNTDGWMDMADVDEKVQMNSVYTCKKCLRKWRES